MKTLAKKNLTEVLSAWSKNYDILTPSIREQGDYVFDIFNEETLVLDYGKPALSPKSVCLPQSEITFTVKEGVYEGVSPGKNVLIFGIRSCDMMGLLQAESFMTRDKKDIYFERRKERVLTAVMVCDGPQNETCFCTTTRSGPWAEKGFDLQLFDVGDVFIVEAGSDEGRTLMEHERFMDDDEYRTNERLLAFKERASERIGKVPEFEEAMARLKAGKVYEGLWNYFGDKCISCGGCAFVCPTCTCFNVYDQVTGPEEGFRVRAWDACLFGGFTREASGHNPRGSQALRIRRRHEHKLLYYNETDINTAISGCVGCGRCSDYCPVKIGTLEVVKAIAGG